MEGEIISIVGTMFSGKSTELIRRLNRLKVSGYEVQLYKPKIDDRYSKENVSSHDKLQFPATIIEGYEDLKKHYDPNKKVLGIDEIQFLESDVLSLLKQHVLNSGIVIVSGLLKDFKDDFFKFKDGKKDMSELLRISDEIVYLKAICTYETENGICGREATRVQRFVDGKVASKDSPLIVVGSTESYAPRCRKHYHFYD